MQTIKGLYVELVCDNYIYLQLYNSNILQTYNNTIISTQIYLQTVMYSSTVQFLQVTSQHQINWH